MATFLSPLSSPPFQEIPIKRELPSYPAPCSQGGMEAAISQAVLQQRRVHYLSLPVQRLAALLVHTRIVTHPRADGVRSAPTPCKVPQAAWSATPGKPMPTATRQLRARHVRAADTRTRVRSPARPAEPGKPIWTVWPTPRARTAPPASTAAATRQWPVIRANRATRRIPRPV